jgi:dTDP-4-amino-4,6-dideoxygalactose transaminase
MAIRLQLPAYSPLSPAAALLATRQLFRLGGDRRPELEALVAREFRANSVLLCGSGTQALTIAIRQARARAGADAPVALPAYSCFDVASAAVGADVHVSLYDLDPDTLGPDLMSLERVLKAGAGVVVVAPLYGTPVDWDAIAALSRRYGAALIEDAAQGIGASWKGNQLGTLGDISVLSFGRGKGWTGGGGGAVLFRTGGQKSVNHIPAANFNQETTTSLSLVAQWIFGRPSLYRVPQLVPGLGLGETKYRPPSGVTSISRSAAAVLLSTYESSKRESGARRTNAHAMLTCLADNPRVKTFRTAADAIAGYLRLAVRVSAGLRVGSDALVLGVVRGYPRILAELSQLSSRLSGPERSWPGSKALVAELVTLPTHSRLTHEDMSRAVALLGDNS